MATGLKKVFFAFLLHKFLSISSYARALFVTQNATHQHIIYGLWMLIKRKCTRRWVRYGNIREKNEVCCDSTELSCCWGWLFSPSKPPRRFVISHRRETACQWTFKYSISLKTSLWHRKKVRKNHNFPALFLISVHFLSFNDLKLLSRSFFLLNFPASELIVASLSHWHAMKYNSKRRDNGNK